MNKTNCLKRSGYSAENLAFVIGLAICFMSTSAFAADEIGGGVCALVNVLTGKWLFGFTILATLGGGAAILFGAEITDGLKKVATIITVVGLILGMTQILTMAFSKFNGMTC